MSWNDHEDIAETSADVFSLNENLPFSTIPLLISADMNKYRENLVRFTRECNRVYNEFLATGDGCLFQGQVVIIGDSIGSLLVYDSLCQLNSTYANSEGLSTSSSQSNLNQMYTKKLSQKSKKSSTKTTSTSSSPLLKRNETNPLINISNVHLDLDQSDLESSSATIVTQCGSSGADSLHGIDFSTTSYLTPLQSSGQASPFISINLEDKLEFDVSHFFVFGSPLGLVLAYRKLAHGSRK